jgi:TonB family protein
VGPSTLQLRLDPRITGLQIPESSMDFSVDRNTSAAVVAPTLQGDGHSGIQPYVRRAGLRRGEGATVVLRIEVSDMGAPNRIVVDTSSGSRLIDAAAVEFAQMQHWYAGRINGRPHAMWIRWGIRLQA